MALLPANPGEGLWIGPGAGKNHYNVGIGLGDSGGQNHEDFDQTLIEDGFVYSIAGGTSPYNDADKFYLNASGNPVFRINAGAGRTSTNTAHPRCECRELTPGGEKAAWDGRSGEHYLRARCRITEVTSNRPWVCFGQIHGSEGSPEPSDLVRLQCEGANGTTTNLSLVCRRSPPGGGGEIRSVLKTGYNVGDWFTYEIRQASSGRLIVSIDGAVVLDVAGMGQIKNYFKFGCYLQDNVEKGAAADDFAAVEFERGSVVTWHTGYAAPTTPVFTGGSDPGGGTGGGNDAIPPTIPQDIVGVRDDQEVALSWEESSDNVAVTHYNVYRFSDDGTTGGGGTTSTLGRTASSETTTSSTADKLIASKATASAGGTLTVGHARAWLSASGSTSSRMLVYADSSGSPGALLATSDQITIDDTATDTVQDYTFTDDERIAVTAGTVYWIALSWDDPGAPSLTYSRDGGAAQRVERSDITYGTFPDPFGTATGTFSGPIDAWVEVVDGTVGSGSGTTTTLGKTSNGTQSSASSANKTAVSSFTASADGTLTAGHARAWLSSSGSATTKVVVYADSTGAPGALLAESDAVVITATAEDEVDYVFSGAEQIDITNGTTYWVGLSWQDPGTPSINLSRDATASQRQENNNYLADPFGTPTAQSGPIDVYVDVVEAASEPGFVLIGTTTGTTYTDTGLTNGTPYTYVITAEDAAGNESGTSEEVTVTPGEPDTTAPTVPDDLAVVTGDRQAVLTWSASTDADTGVSHYVIYRDGSEVGDTEDLTFTDVNLTNGNSYEWTVAAVDVSGNESAPSDGVTGTPSAPVIDGVPLFPLELGPDARHQLEIAFGADVTADPDTWVWTNVTRDVRQEPGIACSLGRGEESGRSNPASLTLTLDNESGDYSLGGRSVHYPNVRRGTPVRWRIDPGDSAGPRAVFWGYANGFTPQYASTLLTGPTRTVALSASGVLRRLGQGDAPVMSPYRRAMLADTSIVAYWPMEEGKATTFAPAVRGGTELAVASGEVTWASNEDFNCSAPLPAVRTGFLTAGVDPYTATGENEFRVLVSIPDDGIPDGVALCHVAMTGSIARWDITYETGATSAGLGLYRIRDDGTRQGDVTVTPLPLNGNPVRLTLQVSQDGPDIDWLIGITPADPAATAALFLSGTITGETCGIIRQIELNPHGTGADMAMGHVTVANEIASQWDEIAALTAYAREYPTSANGRLGRLCRENGLHLTRYSSPGESVSVMDKSGPQLVAPVLDLLHECEQADHGQLWDGRDPGLSYTTRRYRENGNVGLTLRVDELAPGFAPTDDDQRTRNSWTVTRLQGITSTYEDTDGPMGTDVIDVYDDSTTINTARDDMAVQHAAWLVNLGTVPGYRFPRVVVDARATPHLVPDALDVKPGDRIVITGIADDAAPLAGGTLSLTVEGIEHAMTSGTWHITYLCSPFSPWGVGRVAEETGDTSELVMRVDTDGSSLAATAGRGATSLSVSSTGRVWSTNSDDYPLYLSVGGLPVRATACSGSTSPQTFTVEALDTSRSSGDTVELWDPRPLGLG